MTAWNRREFLREAIRSALTTGELPDELVVVTNYHDPDLEGLVRQHQGQWVVCEIDRFGEATAAGLEACTAPIVSFLDDDDLFLPGRLRVARTAFASAPRLGFLHVGGYPFRSGTLDTLRPPSSEQPAIDVPGGARTPADFQSVWSRDAAYNGSSISVRRELLAPHLGQMRAIRLCIPPYLFFRAWVSDWGFRLDPTCLVAVRNQPVSSTTGRFEHRSVRLPRLREISASLAHDASQIRSFLPPGSWDLALREIIAMHSIFESLDRTSIPRREIVRAAFDLVRERRVWVPRAVLLSLAAARMVSAPAAVAAFRLLAAPIPARREPP